MWPSSKFLGSLKILYLCFSYQSVLLKREKTNIIDLELHSTNELKVIKLKQMFAQKPKYFCHSVRFASIKECETKVGSAAKQKQEDFEHLNRLLEGLQLDKDILTQLKVSKSTFLSLF